MRPSFSVNKKSRWEDMEGEEMNMYTRVRMMILNFLVEGSFIRPRTGRSGCPRESDWHCTGCHLQNRRYLNRPTGGVTDLPTPPLMIMQGPSGANSPRKGQFRVQLRRVGAKGRDAVSMGVQPWWNLQSLGSRFRQPQAIRTTSAQSRPGACGVSCELFRVCMCGKLGCLLVGGLLLDFSSACVPQGLIWLLGWGFRHSLY